MDDVIDVIVMMSIFIGLLSFDVYSFFDVPLLYFLL